MNPTTERTPGIVRDGDSLTVREFCKRMGLQQYAFTQARAAGLRVITVGARKKYVLGSDWLAFLAKQAAKQEAAST